MWQTNPFHLCSIFNRFDGREILRSQTVLPVALWRKRHGTLSLVFRYNVSLLRLKIRGVLQKGHPGTEGLVFLEGAPLVFEQQDATEALQFHSAVVGFNILGGARDGVDQAVGTEITALREVK